MGKHRTSISVDNDIATNLDNVNTSDLVNDLLRRHFAAENKTEAERLRDEIRTEKGAISELEEEIESHEAKIEHLEAQLEDVEGEQEDAVDEVIEYAKKYMTKKRGPREFALSNASGSIGGVAKTEVIDFLDELLPSEIKQIHQTESWDELRSSGYPVDEDGMTGNNWNSEARDIVGLTAEQREQIEDWMDLQ